MRLHMFERRPLKVRTLRFDDLYHLLTDFGDEGVPMGRGEGASGGPDEILVSSRQSFGVW